MHKNLERLRDQKAQDTAVVCYCVGLTCSGCEENTIEVYKAGFNVMYERAKILEEALEWYSIPGNCACSREPWKDGIDLCKAHEALKKYRGEG